jgi:hypothetical protein
MGDSRLILIFAGVLVLFTTPFLIDEAFAKTDYVTAEDLGVLQLAAHDLFNVDRMIPHDFEDGKLNLSTLFDDTVNGGAFNDTTISIGGEPRNRENIMLFTVASQLGEKFVELKEEYGETKAKELTIGLYHKKLSHSYKKAFGENFPDSMDGDATTQENLALRTIHDFLPGKIKVDKKLESTLDPSLNGKKLSTNELKQKSSKLDGKFDPEFLDIHICFPPDFTICIDVNLLDVDRSFGVQFGMEESFDSFMEELEDGMYDEDDRVMYHIRNLMAKGQNF